MLKSINLGVAFVLELCLLVAFAYLGFQLGATPLVKVVLAIGAAVLVALIWGRYMAPKSETRLTGAAYLALKFVLFGLAALGLAIFGQGTLAIIFAVVSLINQVLLLVWQQETLQEVSPKKKHPA
jgi:hypothetical protein